MAKANRRHECRECGTESATWQGRCGGCGEFNTLDPVLTHPASGAERPWSGGGVRRIVDVDAAGWEAAPTGVAEFDRVLGGGLVSGSVTLLGGEPGIGKSTLLLQVAASIARSGSRVLYTSGEEAAPQVRNRAERLDALAPDLWLAADTSLTAVLAACDTVDPTLLIVDSVQTLSDPDHPGTPGSLTQLRSVVARLVAEAKTRPLTVLLVGHVTKDGNLAGPRALEHLVDTVLAFEGDDHHALRLLRATKHRFGSTDELGVFEMAAAGLVGVADPSALFLADRMAGIPGSVVVPTIDGHRPLLVEVQALTSATTLTYPRRTAQGLDSGRLGLLLAVLDRHAGIDLAKFDVYASAVGGARVAEPGADLAVALAVASACANVGVPGSMVACAEVGLAGEVRRVAHLERRLAEAARLGFETALVPPRSPVPPGIVGIEVASLTDALRASRILGGRREPAQRRDHRASTRPAHGAEIVRLPAGQ